MWKRRVWSNDAATGTTFTAYQSFLQAPGARLPGAFVAAPLREIAVLVESHTHVVVASVIVVVPLLHTSAPAENELGPVAGALESSPTTFHSMGVIDREVPAASATSPSVEVVSTSRTPAHRLRARKEDVGIRRDRPDRGIPEAEAG